MPSQWNLKAVESNIARESFDEDNSQSTWFYYRNVGFIDENVKIKCGYLKTDEKGKPRVLTLQAWMKDKNNHHDHSPSLEIAG